MCEHIQRGVLKSIFFGSLYAALTTDCHQWSVVINYHYFDCKSFFQPLSSTVTIITPGSLLWGACCAIVRSESQISSLCTSAFTKQSIVSLRSLLLQDSGPALFIKIIGLEPWNIWSEEYEVMIFIPNGNMDLAWNKQPLWNPAHIKSNSKTKGPTRDVYDV